MDNYDLPRCRCTRWPLRATASTTEVTEGAQALARDKVYISTLPPKFVRLTVITYLILKITDY